MIVLVVTNLKILGPLTLIKSEFVQQSHIVVATCLYVNTLLTVRFVLRMQLRAWTTVAIDVASVL